MNKSYVIEWKSLVNGRAGRGTKVFEQAAAQRLAEELNREYPGIYHQIAELNSNNDSPGTGPRHEPVQEPETAAGALELNQSPDFAFSFE